MGKIIADQRIDMEILKEAIDICSRNLCPQPIGAGSSRFCGTGWDSHSAGSVGRSVGPGLVSGTPSSSATKSVS